LQIGQVQPTYITVTDLAKLAGAAFWCGSFKLLTAAAKI
jgi:hypothetical protein